MRACIIEINFFSLYHLYAFYIDRLVFLSSAEIRISSVGSVSVLISHLGNALSKKYHGHNKSQAYATPTIVNMTDVQSYSGVFLRFLPQKDNIHASLIVQRAS